MAKKTLSAFFAFVLAFSLFAVVTAFDDGNVVPKANAESGTDCAITTAPAVPSDSAIPDESTQVKPKDGIIVSADEHYCGCCHKHNHGEDLFDRIKCFFCKILSFFKKETNITHRYVETVETTATCTANGYTVYRCAVCGTSSVLVTPAYGHSIVFHAGVAPTCEKSGFNAYKTCSRCGFSTFDGEIPAIGHNFVTHPKCEPTCEHVGWDEYEECTNCGKSTYKEIPAIGSHNFVWKHVAVSDVSAWSDGTHIKTCTKCGATTGLAVECDLGDIVYNKDKNGNDILPSCSRAVNYYQECSVCGGKKQDSFKKLPHKYDTEQTDLVSVVTDPTCTTEGTISVKCTMCKSNAKTFTTRALGHDVPDTENIKEGDSIVCNRCHEALKPEAFDYDDNEFLIWASGRYYYKGRAKTLTGHNTYTGKPIYDEAEMTLAIAPGKSLYMRMPFDGSTEIGYLAYVEKNKWTGKDEVKKYFETEYEGKRYYFYLDDDMIGMINGDSTESMEFPSPTDTDFDTRLDVDLKNADRSLVVYEGNICTRFTFGLKSGGELRAYLNGKKLLLVETRNAEGEVTDATYFDEIATNIPSYMTTNKNGTVLSGMVGLLQFANYIGILN